MRSDLYHHDGSGDHIYLIIGSHSGSLGYGAAVCCNNSALVLKGYKVDADNAF